MGILNNLSRFINLRSLRKDLEAINDLVADSISNIMLLIATKQNNLGFTPENVANKNAVNGYLGLNANNRIDSIKRIKDINKFSFSWDFLNPSITTSTYLFTATVYSGAGTFSANGSTNTPKPKTGNNTQIQLPILQLSAGVTGYVATTLATTPITLLSPFKLYSEQIITAQCNTAKQFKMVVSCGSNTINSATGFHPSANTLVFIIDPTINNYKWQVGKVINGSLTPINTDVGIINENLIALSIEYDRLTEIAKFYINYELVYEMTAVNLPSTATFANQLAMSTNDATETYVRRMSPLREVLEIDLS